LAVFAISVMAFSSAFLASPALPKRVIWAFGCKALARTIQEEDFPERAPCPFDNPAMIEMVLDEPRLLLSGELIKRLHPTRLLLTMSATAF
jgi:hypothetical protein